MDRERRSTIAHRLPGLVGSASGKGFGIAMRLALVLSGLWLLAAAFFGQAAQASTGAVDSAHRHHMAPETVRSLADYSIPRVALVREDGKNVVLSNEIDDGKPVELSFVYTTCTTICPLTSMTFSQLQGRLGAARGGLHLVSISIDREQDTPARLREYALKFEPVFALISGQGRQQLGTGRGVLRTRRVALPVPQRRCARRS